MEQCHLARFLLNLLARVPQTKEQVAVSLHKCLALFVKCDAFRAGLEVSAFSDRLQKFLLFKLFILDIVQRQFNEFASLKHHEVLQKFVVDQLLAPAACLKELLYLPGILLFLFGREIVGRGDLFRDWGNDLAWVHYEEAFAETAEVFETALDGPFEGIGLDCEVHFLRLTVQFHEAFAFSLLIVDDTDDDGFLFLISAGKNRLIYGIGRSQHGVDGVFWLEHLLEDVEVLVLFNFSSWLEVHSLCFSLVINNLNVADTALSGPVGHF